MSNSRSLTLTSLVNRRHLVTENSAFESENESSFNLQSDSIGRRPTISGLPHTLIYQPSQERQMNLSVRPQLILYNENKYEQLTFTSVDRISAVPNDERLWIDVRGVSRTKTMTKNIE